MTELLLGALALALLFALLFLLRLRRENEALRRDLRRALRAGADTVEAQGEELRWRRALAETSGVIAAVADREKRLHYLSPAARALFGGFERGEDALHRLRHHILDELLDEALRRGPGNQREITLDGRHYVARVAAAPPAPPFDWLFLLMEDVTELRALRRARRDMASNLSHELRTPLASVKLLAESLLGGAVEEPALARRLVGRIDTENEALIRLVEDLTALTWIESGRAPIRLAPVALGEFVAQRLARLAPLFEARQLRAELRGEAPRPVPLDAERLGQALGNVLDNAIKFSPPGGAVTVTLAQGEGQSSIAVRDEGPGILPADLARIFERFYKGDRVRTRSVGGSGLGLAIAKHMVEAHGGAITAESEYGHGATITITLPNA